MDSERSPLTKMHPTAAANAMQWNIELDRGLRSQIPGSGLEAILRLGIRLQQWSREPPMSAITASLFKLEPGQEQAFANAIMMHLTEAFRSADNFTRFCIIKVLHLEMRRGKNKVSRKGLITRERVPNHVEVLKRVKSVAGSGDHIARALALWAIGCLVELARDSLDVLQLVMKALESKYEHEVHAALFALGRLCEASEHFASLALGSLYDLATNVEATLATKLLAVRTLARMQSSALIALGAFQIGKILIVSTESEELVVTTLEALSKLAQRCSIVLEDQVALLRSYLSLGTRLFVRMVSLKCLTKLARNVTGRIGCEELVDIMITIHEIADEPFAMKALATEFLKEVLPFYALAADGCRFKRLLSVVKSTAMNPEWVQMQPMLDLLVTLVCMVGKLRPDVLKAECMQIGDDSMDSYSHMLPHSCANEDIIGSVDLVTQVALLVGHQLALLGGNRLEGAELKKKCLSLNRLFLQLVQDFPSCRFAVVDTLSGTVEGLLQKVQNVQHNQRDPISILLRMTCICIIKCCLVCLPEDEGTRRIARRLSELVSVCTAASFPHHFMEDILRLLLKVKGFLSFDEAQAIMLRINHTAVACVEEGDYWSAYKVVMRAACHGFWSGYSSVMESIVSRAQSGDTYAWLKALAAMWKFEEAIQAECEMRKHATSAVAMEVSHEKPTDKNKIARVGTGMHGHLGQAIARELTSAVLAEDLLAAAVKLDRTFEFQRWLLNLRVTFVRTSGELLSLLGPICVGLQASDVGARGTSFDMSLSRNAALGPLFSGIQAAACRSQMFCEQFQKLSTAFDVCRLSCIGIDRESANILSLAALGCSLLSFCTLCMLKVPQMLVSGKDLDPSLRLLVASVAHELYQRLSMVGGAEDWLELRSLVLHHGGTTGSFLIAHCAHPLEKQVSDMMTWAVREVLHLQEDINLKSSDTSGAVLLKGVHILRDIVEMWLCFPWALPGFFLCTRPSVRIEVFSKLVSRGHMGERSVAHGLLAPLTLCFQVSNLELNSSIKLKRLCCAVLIKSVTKQTSMNGDLHSNGKPGWCINKAMYSESELLLLEKLLKEFSFSKNVIREDPGTCRKDGRTCPPTVICDLNDKGQGFASCLLETADLECGLFHISILGVCLDNKRHCWIVSPAGGPTLRIIPSMSEWQSLPGAG